MSVTELMQQAFQAANARQVEQAESLYLQVVEANAEQIDAWMALASLAAQTQRPAIAAQRFEQVLQLDGENCQARLFLGVLQSHLGQNAAAKQNLHRVLELQPANPQALVSLAQLAYRSGEIEKAIGLYDRALSVRPNDPDLLCSRAACFLGTIRLEEAEADLVRAAKLRPTADVSIQLGEIALKVGRVQDAAEYATQALSREPDNWRAHRLTATARTMAGQDAGRSWDEAERKAPEPAILLTAKAEAYNLTGHFERSREALLSSLEHDSSNGETYYALVASRRQTPADSTLRDRIEALLKNEHLESQDRLYLLYALGKIQNDLGEYQAAIETFDQANELRPKQPFDREAFVAFVDTQIKLYPTDLVSGDDSSLPIFVCGMMRSGTSLMEQLLTCHPNFGGAGEQPFWHQQEPSVRKGLLQGHTVDLKATAAQFVKLLSGAAPRRPRVIDKNPANALLAGLLSAAHPSGKIVHMRRNPMDTVLSIWMTPMRTTASFIGTRSDIVFAYKQYRRLSEHWRQALPSNAYREVEYEQLVAQPEETLRSVLGFLGEDWDPACLHPERNARPVLTPSFWQVRQPLYKSSTERRRKYEPWLGEFAELI